MRIDRLDILWAQIVSQSLVSEADRPKNLVRSGIDNGNCVGRLVLCYRWPCISVWLRLVNYCGDMAYALHESSSQLHVLNKSVNGCVLACTHSVDSILGSDRVAIAFKPRRLYLSIRYTRMQQDHCGAD